MVRQPQRLTPPNRRRRLLAHARAGADQQGWARAHAKFGGLLRHVHEPSLAGLRPRALSACTLRRLSLCVNSLCGVLHRLPVATGSKRCSAMSCCGGLGSYARSALTHAHSAHTRTLGTQRAQRTHVHTARMHATHALTHTLTHTFTHSIHAKTPAHARSHATHAATITAV